jgi:hypothetical protein
MNDDEPRDPALSALLPLDERTGPAADISPAQEAEMVRRALDHWQTTHAKRSVSTMPLRTWMMAAAALLMCVAGARAFYVWMQAAPAPTTAPMVAPSPAVTPVAAPNPAPAIEDDKVQRAPRPQAGLETDHLLRANRLRADGRYRDAVRAYQRVIASDTGVSAYVARVAAASILLEHLGSPKTARTLFIEARTQRPRDTLDKEIARGIAECDKQLDAQP